MGGTLYLSHAGEAMSRVRDLLLVEGPDYAGAHTLIDDMLVVRYLGGSTERARRLFMPWHHLRPQHDRPATPACRASGPPESPRARTMELTPREKDKLLLFTARWSPSGARRAA